MTGPHGHRRGNKELQARSLVVGLDGADLDIVLALGKETLPHLHALIQRGAFAALGSLQPPATLPNWLTFLTGVDPAVHGVFDFTIREGYRVRFTAGSVREAPTIAARLDRMGLACACIGFPGTWPPERLRHGIFISGWDSPVAFEADGSFVWPPQLYRQIVARFGRQRFDDVDEFGADRPGWHDRLSGALVERIFRKTDLVEWLLDSRKWDLFAVYFGESDTAAHHLWAFHDPNSPRRPRTVTPLQQMGLSDVYRALDGAVGRLLQSAGGERVEVTVLSDHGSGGSSDKVLYLNRFLQQAGLLRSRDCGLPAALIHRARDVAVPLLWPRARDRLFRTAGRALPAFLESRARFGAIDMKRTVMFSDELNYFPAIHFNLHGREPDGILKKTDIPRARRDLEQALADLRDPWTGRPAVASVHAREELFHGPFLHRAPDLLLRLHQDPRGHKPGAGYCYNLAPSAGAPPGCGAWRKLGREEYLGRKGRGLSGSHRPTGLFIAAGPLVSRAGRVAAGIADAAAAVVARLAVQPPPGFAGCVPASLLGEENSERELPGADIPSELPAADQARVRSRLRALGYIE